MNLHLSFRPAPHRSVITCTLAGEAPYPYGHIRTVCRLLRRLLQASAAGERKWEGRCMGNEEEGGSFSSSLVLPLRSGVMLLLAACFHWSLMLHMRSPMPCTAMRILMSPLSLISPSSLIRSGLSSGSSLMPPCPPTMLSSRQQRQQQHTSKVPHHSPPSLTAFASLLTLCFTTYWLTAALCLVSIAAALRAHHCSP